MSAGGGGQREATVALKPTGEGGASRGRRRQSGREVTLREGGLVRGVPAGELGRHQRLPGS